MTPAANCCHARLPDYISHLQCAESQGAVLCSFQQSPDLPPKRRRNIRAPCSLVCMQHACCMRVLLPQSSTHSHVMAACDALLCTCQLHDAILQDRLTLLSASKTAVKFATPVASSLACQIQAFNVVLQPRTLASRTLAVHVVPPLHW